MMEESIDVTGISGPDPMLGCGLILAVIGIIVTISTLGYLLFKVNIMLLLLLYGILAIVVGIVIIVLCLKVRNHGKV